MAQPVDAEWAQELYACRVERIKELGGPRQAETLGVAKAALDATIKGLAAEDQALYLFEGRREAVYLTIADPTIRRARLEKAESAMLACFTGPDTLPAAWKRTAYDPLA